MPLADTLLRLAEHPGLFEARWSNDILAEVTRTLVRRFGKSADQARYREQSMRAFFPGSLVTGYEHMVTDMRNHPKDRHVLAAAVSCEADFLVTFNLRDFPAHATEGMGLTIVAPSAFLRQIWSLDREAVEHRLSEQASAIGITKSLLLEKLQKVVPGFVEAIHEL